MLLSKIQKGVACVCGVDRLTAILVVYFEERAWLE